MSTQPRHQDEDLARRVYAYFVFRLRPPEDAERLTRLSFERIWHEASLRRDVEQEPDLPMFAAARAVIADNPPRRGATRVAPTGGRADGGATWLKSELAMAIGRLDRRERDALALRFGAELSVGEIAELLDRTPADIKQRLARGIRRLLGLGVLPKESRTGQSAAKRPGSRGSQQGQAEQGEAEE
jgi:DNA-directed RNA polymerase specialized sigma24 family protein